MPSGPSGKALVECRAQALKVRIVLWASAIIAAITTVSGWMIFQSFGLSPADGGVLRPVGERMMFGGAVVLLGLVLFGGMLLYASLYLIELRRTDEVLEVTTIGLISDRSRTLLVADVGELNYHAGRMFTPRGHNVDAPWLTMPVRGRLLPYVIDVQAEHVDRPELQALEKNAWRARLKEKAARSDP